MAKRRLSDFNFEGEGSHIALVHRDQGGPANGVAYALITKATKDIKEKDVEKATEVQVTMDMVDFLCKFFGLWYEDAIVLAAIFGYEDIDEAYSFQESADAYEEYLQERVDAVSIMKSLVLDNELDDIRKAVGSLPAKDYLAILKVQEHFEKNFGEVSKKIASLKKSSAKEGVTAEKSAISPSVDKNKEEEDSMSEFMTKAAVDAAIQKAVADAVKSKDEELTKALEEVKTFKEKEAETILQSRKSAISGVEKNAEAAEELFKSLQELPQEAFDVVIKSLEKQKEKLEKAGLLDEVGGHGKEVTHEDPAKGEDITSKLLKAQFQKGE